MMAAWITGKADLSGGELQQEKTKEDWAIGLPSSEISVPRTARANQNVAVGLRAHFSNLVLLLYRVKKNIFMEQRI